MKYFPMTSAIALFGLALLSPAASAAPDQAQPIAASPAALADAGHQRLLPLEGGRNFRDLGGYRTADGRTVKWGTLFRSGSMHDLTATDFATLSKMGLRTVTDFRDTRERQNEPVAWPQSGSPQVFADDYSMNIGSMMQLLSAPGLDAAKAQEMMATTYRELPYQFAGQYKRMFGELLAGHAPLAFNCSAGKDRTGVAAALLLTALGVPRETVTEDYLLSNRYFRPTANPKPGSAEEQMAKALPPAVLQAMMGVDRSYLDAAFAAIEQRSGSVDGYFRTELGLDDAALQKLRALYLDPNPA